MKERNREKEAVRLYCLGNWVVRITGSLIFLYLTWYAFKYTQYMLPGGGEIPTNVFDSRTKNILALAVAVCLMAAMIFLEKRVGRKTQLLVCRVSIAVTMLWIGAAGTWWIWSSSHIPVGDQAFIYGGANFFINGNYSFLDVNGYCGMYPHQLGLTALCELLFRVTGSGSYRVCEAVCLIMAVGGVYIGYRILSEITRSTAAIAGYNILMLGCLPLIFYTPWVYGEIPSIFFALLAEWMLLRYEADGKKRYLAVMVCSLVLAFLVRRNSLILLVAVCIAVLLHALLHKDLKIVAAFLLTAVLACGSYEAIYKMYEIRSGYEHSEGIPMITWVTMGMMQNYEDTYGWFNNYSKEVFFEAGMDTKAAAEAAKRDLTDRLKVFLKNPSYARKFFREKILSQWNEPLYQALFFNADTQEERGAPAADSLAARISDSYFVRTLSLCDRWQFIIYVGMLCYYLFAVKRDSSILQHVLAITIIGGFFFSIIFEAKARYIFPYYVMMFPFAAYGYQQAVWQIGVMLKGSAKDRKITDIREGRRAA